MSSSEEEEALVKRIKQRVRHYLGRFNVDSSSGEPSEVDEAQPEDDPMEGPSTGPVRPRPRPMPLVNHNSETGVEDTIYENDAYKIKLIRAAFRRYEQFGLDDGLYELVFVPKEEGNESPFLNTMYDSIGAALGAAIDVLKDSYQETEGEDRQLFITILGDDIVDGLNTDEFV